MTIRQGGLCLSKKELKVFQVVEAYRAGDFTLKEAAWKLGQSVRYVQRKLKAIREKGIEGLVHGNRGREPVNKKKDKVRQWYMDLYKSTYYDFNFLHAFEYILDKHKVPEEVCYGTFCNWLNEENLGKKRKTRPSKARIARERHANKGLMIQFDGSPHRYNGQDEWTLIHAIDDATSELLGAELHPSETTWACMNVIRRVIEQYGVPEFILTDKAGWSARVGKRARFSQFERACNELGIVIIPTSSAPSKGRVERSFRTAQGRLPQELRLEGIKHMETANRYIEQIFKPKWNQKFAVEPKCQATRFKSIPSHLNLNEIFCMKYVRKVNRDHTINFGGKRYKIPEPPKNLWKHEVEIRKYEDGSHKVFYGAEEIAV